LIVATAVGLYFTPEAFQQTIDHFVSMVIAAVLTIGAGFTTAIVLYRLTKCDGTVAFFASMPGGPAEMAVLAGGQVLLGISLGANFRREQFARDLKFSIALVATTVVLLVQCAAVAAGLWLVDSGPSLASYLLATAPGSVTEMALTAKLLGQRVALVTAYHLVRIFIIIPLAPVLYRAFRRALSGRMTFDNLMD
jgi:hypothetical protein